MAEMSISELRARTGLASSALRFYERKGLLRASGRVGGKRCYDERAVEQVALVDLLKLAGFTLSEIAVFTGPSGQTSADWRAMGEAKLRELDDRMREIEQARTALRHMLECRDERLDDCPVHHRMLREHAATLAADARTPGAREPGQGGESAGRVGSRGRKA